MDKRFVKLDTDNRVVGYLEYKDVRGGWNPGLLDVTARSDGPWLGKVYDQASDTFSCPPTAALEASEESIERGGTVKLAWKTGHATAAEIDHGVGAVDPVAGGSVDVSPRETKTYTLTAAGAAGTTPATASVTVEVTQPPAE